VVQSGHGGDVYKGKVLGAFEVNAAGVAFGVGELFDVGRGWGRGGVWHASDHVVPWVEGLGHEGQFQDEQCGEEDGCEPLDPGIADEIDEAPQDRSDQQARVDG